MRKSFGLLFSGLFVVLLANFSYGASMALSDFKFGTNSMVVDSQGFIYVVGQGSKGVLCAKYDPSIPSPIWKVESPRDVIGGTEDIKISEKTGRVYTTVALNPGGSGGVGAGGLTTCYDSNSGKVVWQKVIINGVGGQDGTNHLALDNSGKFLYVVGRTTNGGQPHTDILTVQYDALSGDEKWVLT